ncbi:MAG: hypothetical protein KC468_23985, partial [Myxococcales bacterium]|nr:hypothetical protein [Myxococcales bacterium]
TEGTTAGTGSGSSGGETTIGPCLDYPPPTTSSPTSTGSTSDATDTDPTTTGTSTGTMTETSTGPCLDFPPTTGGFMPEDEGPESSPEEQTRKAAIDRVLRASALPADVKARLRARIKNDQG